jgi:hypothetical protein
MVAKYLSQKNIVAKFQDPAADTDISLLLKTDYYHIAVVVDLECKGNIIFLSHVSY